jgi:hypothetical protein
MWCYCGARYERGACPEAAPLGQSVLASVHLALGRRREEHGAHGPGLARPGEALPAVSGYFEIW